MVKVKEDFAMAEPAAPLPATPPSTSPPPQSLITKLRHPLRSHHPHRTIRDPGNCSSPAKFYFGPGFEPRRSAGGHGCSPGPSYAGSEYVVMFHVNPGVTITFQTGEGLEILTGPVTVPMVSTNSAPPIAMPVQVPPGHVVQQIVDENGTLRHVILSAAATAGGLVPLPSHNSQHFGAGPGNGTNHQPPQPPYYHHTSLGPSGYPPGSAQFHAGHSPGGGGERGTHHLSSSAAGTGGRSPPPGAYYKDERAQRQHSKLRKKLQDKQQLQRGADGRKELLVNGLKRCAAAPGKEKGMNSVGTSEDGEGSSVHSEEDSVQAIADVLSSVQAPRVSELTSRSALIQWAPPVRLSEAASSDSHELEIVESDIRYEVLLSDKSKEMKFKSIYNGNSLSCRIQDLRPGQDYSLCLQVHLDELQGSATELTKFTTPPCEPDQPQPPKLISRTKNSLQLRWNAVNDNGSHILHYVLECDDGKPGGGFMEFHKSRGKQHTLQKLQPASAYRFRLAAVNEIGVSEYSDVVVYCTQDNPPTQPSPPLLKEVAVNQLHLQWHRRPKDDEFMLQMNDPKTKYGYLMMYHGRDTQYVCSKLNCFSEYRFRLRVQNECGSASPWSEEVTYCTLPDRPSRPSKPVVKGRIHAHSFKLKWDPPTETGGSTINKYVLEVNSGSGYEAVYCGSETEAICDRLTPGTTYQLRVCCSGSGGQSAYSDPCTVTTDAISPGQCPSPHLHGKPKAMALAIRWPEPDYDGGAPVLEYEVEMVGPDASRSLVSGKARGENSGECTLVQSEGSDGRRYCFLMSRAGLPVEMECCVSDLRPGCPYTFRVRAVNRVGPGVWSEPLTVSSGAAPPDAPPAPRATCKTPFHVLVEWEKPPANGAPVTEYRLEMSDTATTDNDEQFHPLYRGPDQSHDVKALSPFSTYYFRVQAANSAGCSPYSLVSMTVTPAAPPSAVSQLRARPTSTSINLSWNEPNDNGSPVTHYMVEVGDRLMSTETPVSEYEIVDLHPDTNYKIKVQAVNEIGPGTFSSTLRATTLRLPPAAPRLECMSVGHNYLKLKWGEGRNTDYTQYCVEMEQSRAQGEFQCVYRGTAFTCKVNKLHELTAHRFRICASNDAGTGPYSNVYEFTTGMAPPAALKIPRIVEVEQGTCTLEWTPSKNAFVDPVVYVVQIAKVKDLTFKEVYRGVESKFTVTDLDPGVDYCLRVAPVRRANYGELSGPFSPSVHVTTPLLDSSSPAKSLALTLQNPAHARGNRNLLQSIYQNIRHPRTMSDVQCIICLCAILILVVGILLSEAIMIWCL